ncbi:UNVERIFIED_CONTAM: hypothetical protein FKN15_020765 [Acipenser sinensis]
MGSPAVDSSQWLSVKEETIFLHDGLIRVTDLAELPSEIGVSEPGDTEQEILTFETKNPTELAERLRTVCGNQSNAYARLLEYRLNALRGLWNAQRQLALEDQQERESSGDEETVALLKRQGLLQQPEQAPFTSRMGLLLVFPLIQSQSRTDPALCNITAEVLLACLRDCQPLSLTKEPADCLNGLESLLCSWLEDHTSSGEHIPQKQKENAAAALVALACARGSLKTLIHTVHLLQKQTDLGYLPVADVLYRLLVLEGGPGSPSCLLGGKHMVSWGFEDMLPVPDNSSGSGSDSKDTDLGRSLGTDGCYLYTTNSFGKGISKLGSGLHGTLRGFVYCCNEELEAGWVSFSNCRLLHRPVSFDNKPHYLFHIIDQFTLQVCQIVPMPVNHFPVGSSMTTVHLCSDGSYVYWIWSLASLNEKTPKGHSVFMDVFQLTVRATCAVNTSCGIPLKTLRRTPMYTCGTYLVMLVSPPGVSGSSATRSLFGGASGLSSLKILASSLVFNISDGQFTSRADLIDATGSSLGRGAVVPGLGACYDTMNNLIWTCSNDYMDQWCNPGNQAFHHVCQRLGVSHIITEPQVETVATTDVINQLLHHVGAMCIHQLNILAASRNVPISSFLGKQHPIEAQHFSSICDIMEKAMVNKDTCIIRCILVVFQVVFTFFFNPQTERNRETVRRSGLLLWQLLMAPVDQISAEIQKEVCLAISSGLNTLYPGEAEFNNLLRLVLTEGKNVASPSLSYLMAVQNHLLSNTVLIKPDEHDDSDSSLQGETLKVQTALLLKTQSPVFSDTADLPWGSAEKGILLSSAESFRSLEEREEPGFLTGLKIPAPWAAGKTVETVHPVRDNYKFKDTVHIPGARCLYLRFDPRCSSQYDYDKDREFTYPSDVLIPPPGPITGSYFDLPRIRLPPGIMGRLREISGRARPQFRPSIKEVIQPDVMEEVIVSCVIKHLTLIDALQTLVNFQYREEHGEEYDLLCKIMAETFKKINAMERQLQNKMKELELLCSLKEVVFDCSDLENVVLTLREKFTQEVNSLIQKAAIPLVKTKALVKSLMNRAELLLHVTIAAQSRSLSGTPADTPACKSVSETKPMSHAVKQPIFLRSMSAPSDLEMIASEDLEFNRGNQRSHIGKAILSQPACVSKLLSLLLDQRPSPKLVLIILQLCRAALPLMSVEDCGNVELPPWSYSIQTLDTDQDDPGDPASKIASLLLAKLADYVVPGCQTVLSPSCSEPDTSLSRMSPKNSLKMDKDAEEEGEAVDGKLSIFIHKREDQSSHEVLQPLLSSSEGRPFRLGTGANMEKVVKMDRDMTKSGCCEVITEEAAAALRKATKWAQSGLIVSVGPPVETVIQEAASGLSTGEKKKTAQTTVCRERNTELARSDPVRPFISGHVANSMAAEVIALLHGLLMAPETNTAQIWTSTAEKVLSRALMFIPQLGKYAESILENGSSSGRKLAKLQAIARQAVAALCALGGFKETIKIGSEVQVVGKGILGSVGVVMSINEQEGIAIVKFPSSDYRKTCKASDILTVPISRLITPRSEALPLYKLSITEKVVQAVQSMLLPHEGSLSIHTSLPATGDGSSPVMAVVRLLAEIRTRACLVMAQLLEDSSFCEEFIQQCPAAVEVLNLVAQECSPGERLVVVEAQCERLRMLYRDCARPPPPPLQTDRRQPKEITWCPSRVFPQVRACMFSSRLTSVTFLADPSAGGGLPRGTFIYATSPIPVQAPSFYWEVEVVSYGDSDDDSGPIVSFGFATEAEKRDGAWTNPVGTCLFHKSEEKCLVRSGLVHLMDRLCSLSGQRDCSSNEKQTKKQKVATMAWAAFQVLANRCVEWEKVEGGLTGAVHSGLARQVSSLLTNHLARATECCGNQAAGNDALQDVLSLLNDLSRSHIGKAILSQPACVSKLLSLLLDQRPSPKLVLIILQLCRAALPLMSVEDCGNVELPPWSYSIQTLDTDQDDPGDPASKIASLLLAKLADYVVPGCQTVLSPSCSEPDTSLSRMSPKNSLKMDKDAEEEGEAVDGKLSIFIHKREDQSSHEVLQPLLSSSEGRPFRLGTGANMEKVVKMDRDMTKSGCCEVITEEAAAALRKATKWAQSGLIVSVGPPVETVSQEAASGLSTREKKKTAQTAVCRERNTELARSDPVRPFISGHVANSMAAEVIALLHGLLMAPETNTAQIWTSTAEKVLSRALMFIPQLGKYAESILENGSSSGRKLAKLQAIARQAVAALCALGGFKETIKIGSEVQVVGKGILGSVGVVMSINEQEGIAIVKFPSSDYRKTCKASDILTVPISRLITPRSEALPLYKLSITEKVVQAVQSMLLPHEGSLSIHTSLPATGDGSSPVMAVVRLLAEIRTRACLVMAQLLEDSSFCEEFIQQCPAAVEVLNLVAQECSPGERLVVVEAQCERLRMLYRDCARPPPPPLQTDRRQPKEITWCPSRVFPQVRACMFSSRLTSVTFLADPSAGGGLPRGTFIYATSPIPVQAPSFYWEVEVVSYGDSDDDSGPIVSFGFATEAEKRDGAWTNPVGTCLFHNNGRAVHYNGSSLLQWKSARLDVALVPGDVAGIGWERTEGTPPPPGQAAKGRVYFTYCGQRLPPFLEDVSGGMWPLVHIQKKNTKIRANFGCRPFAYAEGQAHRNAADLCIDLAEEISANFEALPFAMASDSDDAGASVASDPGSHGPPCRIAAVATAIQRMVDIARQTVEFLYEENGGIPRDLYLPTIEDIKDEANKFTIDKVRKGMVDIARQTVEFLYEENGGIPRDLYLPTIEDIKDEANKFTIDKVRKGLTVVIRSPESNNTNSTTGGTALPKFAIRGMLKTFALHGVVLDVDSVNELVQVETYLRSEGVLVRYWYPIDMLERPPAGSRRTAANGLVSMDSTNIQIHRELLRGEAALARLYCRMALLNIFAPKSPHTFTRLFHIPAIRDITLEHLQLLSNQLLAPPLPGELPFQEKMCSPGYAIRRACNAHGGLFKDEIYIPLQEEDPKKPKCSVVTLDCKATEPERPASGTDSLDSSSSVTPAMSVSASASTSQTSICSSSQGVSRTASELSVDQEILAATEVVVPSQQQGVLDPHTVSSQESLDLSLCSTGSLGSLGSLGEPLDSADTASVSDGGSMYTVTSLDNNMPMARPIKGYAVIEVRARAKVEKIRASLFNSSDLIGLSSLDGEEELMEMTTEEILTVSSVNQSLFDTQGSSVLEDYFTDKSIKGDKLVPSARDILTEIFKSCVHSEQMLSLTPAKPIKVSDIYLSKEQINSQTPGNLLHVFFTKVRPPKKVLEDQLAQILRKYGVPKPNKSRYSKAGKEQHQGKVVSTKRPLTKPPTKEKSVLNSVRTALSEKKLIVKPKSPEKTKPEEKDPEKARTKKQEVPEEKYLTLEGFHRFTVDRAKQDIHSVWRAILGCGYDLHFERCACVDTRHAHKASRKWSLEMDVALVQYVNRLCRHLAITPTRLHPHEVYLDPADTADPRVSCLLNVPVESLRLRFALLQSLNNMLETFFLPLVELRQTDTYLHSIAALLREAKGLVCYDTKVAVMNRVLNATVQRTADHAAPEITLDPLEIVGGEIRSAENTYFCQAARQLACVPSSQLCVKLASGGDPTYAFNIRFTGEEVHGTSGSFRHFLWQVCKELQSSALSLLMPCPSSAANRNKGKYILTPGPITYAEEQLLHFLGQLLGIGIRADLPLPLDLLSSFWRVLVGESLDPEADLHEADVLTHNYIKRVENVNDETELEALCTEITSLHHSSESPESPNKPCCKFTYITMTGDEVELCPGGRNIIVGWENKDMYASAIRSLRLRELQNSECMTAVRAGLGSIIPLQLLTTLTALEVELRTCGLPYINLEFLKAHTMYQVGLMETDPHIEFFWTALEMFTQEELCKFIKFACNQERIPFTCPCKDGGPDTAHVPPYPMKIAPPDGTSGSPDSRYIRVETCMFMIKLPQYSSLEIMLEKLRYAIHYREDPLSG